MKKLFCQIKILFLILINQVLPLAGQNLVFNSDVSSVDSCNALFSVHLLSYAPAYFNPTLATPDLFHTCFPSGSIGVPSNTFGYMQPKAGSGYLGFGINGLYFEYLSCKLLQPLKTGYIYCVSFYVAPPMEGCMDQIGVSLTENRYNLQNENRIITNNFKSTPKGEFFCEQGIWRKVEIEYQASGGEQYLTIGQFLPFEEVVFGSIVPPYYYVDVVSVVECAPPPKPLVKLPNVFTPNNDGVNDNYVIEISGAAEVQVQIYNRWGNVVFQSAELNPVWDGNYNGNPVAEGVYFVVVYAVGVNELKTTEKQTVHLVR